MQLLVEQGAAGGGLGVSAEDAMLSTAVDYVLGNHDLLKSIFQHLDIKEVCTAASVCSIWYQVANHDDFWKQIDFRGKQVRPAHALALLRRHPNVEELDLSGLVCARSGPERTTYNGFVQQIAPHLANLHKLRFAADMHCPSPYQVPNQLITHLAAFSALTTLCITGEHLHTPGSLSGCLQHPLLKELVLDGMESSILVIRCPQLTCLSLADALNIRMLELEEVPALVTLDLSRATKLGEASTRAALVRLTSLQELSISGVINLVDQTIQELATTLVQLTKLNMSRVTGVSMAGVQGFTALKELDLSRCDQLTVAALTAALEDFESLESVTLDSCNLASIKLSMPKLRALSVRGCPSLAELELNCWQLSRLDMGPSECFGLLNQNLCKLVVSSGALKQMEWVKLHKLSVVELECPSLTQLHVRDCGFSDPSVLQSLGDTAIAPVLQSDVLETARQAAQPHKQGVAGSSGSNPSSSLQLAHVLPGSSPQARVRWTAQVFEDADSDGEAGALMSDEDFQPGASSDGGSSDSGDHGGDGDDDGAPFGGNRDRRWGDVQQRAASPALPDQSWDGPDRLPSDMVRFGVAVEQLRQGPSWQPAAVVDPAQASNPPAAGAAQAAEPATSSAAAAAAAAAAGGRAGGGPSSHRLQAGRRGRSRGAAASAAANGGACAATAPGAAAATGGAAAGGNSGVSSPAAAAAAGSQRSRFGFIPGAAADAVGYGFDWLRSGFGSRSLMGDRGFIWGSSGDRLQEIPRPRQGAGPDADEPMASDDVVRRRRALDDDRRQADPSRRKSARLESKPKNGSPKKCPHSSTLSAMSDQPPQRGRGARALAQLSVRSAPRSPRRRPRRAKSAGGGGGGGGGDSSDSEAEDGARVAGSSAAGGGPMRRRSRVGAGKGGVPRLRVLHVEGCERLTEVLLSHLALEELVVAGCGSVAVVALHAPKLAVLELQELGDLRGTCLQQVNVSGLTLGSCSSLLGVEISSSSITRLDVRGCGGLQQLWLDCPALQVLDANFCGSLADAGLAGAVASIPPLRQLVLSVCCQIGSSGLSCLSRLTTLHELDLSYTEVTTLQPILEGCPHLRSLSIASCRSLGPSALHPLLDAQAPALPQLTSLDASYCDVSEQLVAQLAIRCTNLQHVALSGCAGVTDAVWEQLHAPALHLLRLGAASSSPVASGGVAAAAAATAGGEALMDVDDVSPQGALDGMFPGSQHDTGAASSTSSSQLESLSLVRCSNLRSLCLGLLPVCGTVELLPPKHYLVAAERAALQAAPYAPGSWVEVDTAVSQLTSLKLGLSGVQVVALSLPKLTHLDLSSCKHLRVLELRCPLLLQLQLQACRCLPMVSAVRGVLGAPQLQMLDVQHMLPQGMRTRSTSGSSSRRGSEAGEGLLPPAEGSSMAAVGASCARGSLGSRAVAGSNSGPGCNLLAAVAAGSDVLAPPAGQSTGVQMGMLLDQVAATHACLKLNGILRCTSLCKVCSKLSQCSI